MPQRSWQGPQSTACLLEDIYLDPLILQVCTTQDQAMHSIKAIKMFQELNDPPMKTVVGLSNISNGVPKKMRGLIDRVYLTLLMYEGLTAAIMNPLDKELMDVIEDNRFIPW